MLSPLRRCRRSALGGSAPREVGAMVEATAQGGAIAAMGVE